MRKISITLFFPGMSRPHFLVVGAGFSGAVIARELADGMECRVSVWESRSHVGGHCHTARDANTGIMVHHYGPHIFNTNEDDVWWYVNRFATMRPFINRVKAVRNGRVYSLPVNLHTLCQIYDRYFRPAEARDFLQSRLIANSSPANFEEQALAQIGPEIYELLFKHYTLKQWGCEPRALPATVFKRLPIRFDFNDNYYNATYQGIPEAGYTALVENIVKHPAIEITTRKDFSYRDDHLWDHVFYTGPLDAFFDFADGRLGYRSLTFERVEVDRPDYQGNAVINYTGPEVPWTRIHEHKHFTPWEQHERSVAFREFSHETTKELTPFYPKRLAADMDLLEKYETRASQLADVTFLGRLATYRYLDMDKVIKEALDTATTFIRKFSR